MDGFLVLSCLFDLPGERFNVSISVATSLCGRRTHACVILVRVLIESLLGDRTRANGRA